MKAEGDSSMDRIMKLPFLSSFAAGVITGVVSWAAGVGDRGIFLRMAVMMLVFFLLGIYVRRTVLSLKAEVQVRMIEQKKEEEQRIRLQKEEQKAAEYAARFNPGKKQKDQSQVQSLAQPQHQVRQQVQPQASIKERAVKMPEDDFEPLASSGTVKTKAKG